jgi:hypothetical protein
MNSRPGKTQKPQNPEIIFWVMSALLGSGVGQNAMKYQLNIV